MAVSSDILRSYVAPGRVMRAILARHPGEERALAFLAGACVLIFVAQWPRLARQAHYDDAVPLQALIMGALMGWIFIAPLLFYALAGVAGLAARAFGLAISGPRMRLTLFWSLLVASPLWLLHGALTGFLGTGQITLVVGLAMLACFFLIWALNIRAALLEPAGHSA